MHAGNQSKAASKLFSFHLNRSHSITSLCSQILNVYPQAVKVNLSACASYAIGASAAHCPHITKETEQHLSTLSSVTPPFFPASISSQLIFCLHRSQAGVKLTNPAELIKPGPSLWCITLHLSVLICHRSRHIPFKREREEEKTISLDILLKKSNLTLLLFNYRSEMSLKYCFLILFAIKSYCELSPQLTIGLSLQWSVINSTVLH